MAPPHTPQQRTKHAIIDLTEDDVAKITADQPDFVDLTTEEKTEAVIDLTTNVDELRAESPAPRTDRDPIPEGFDSIPSYSLAGKTYRPGDGVELDDDEFYGYERGGGDCFRIIHIIRNRETGKVLYRGYQLSCSNQEAQVSSFLPRSHKQFKLTNEYCIMAPRINDLQGGNLEQCLITLDPKDVSGLREIIFTNELFPTFSHFEDPRSGQYRTKGEARKQGQIVVRWKFAIAWNKSGTRVVKGRIERLREEDCDTRYRAIDAKLRESFRGPSTTGVAAESKKRTHADFTEETTYTIGSVCTGAGGSLVGAAQASLKPVFAIDSWDVARKTIHMNFDKYKLKVPAMDAHEFCTSPRQGFEQSDVLEVSWPCPSWSPAKTRPHSDPAVDANNESCIFGTSDLLSKCKPRIATFEQTSGLVTHWPEVFESFVNQIVSANYSLCWEVPDLAYYGAFSHRSRLIVIASCPGEPLPKFPAPTVGVGPGMKPMNTIANALREAARTTAPDDLDLRAGATRARREPSHHGRRLLLATPTCAGITEPHPNGERSFNLFENSLLCSFPSTHRFAGNNTEVKRQLGNAVPSTFMKHLFEHIVKSMRAFDRKVASSRPDVIELD